MRPGTMISTRTRRTRRNDQGRGRSAEGVSLSDTTTGTADRRVFIDKQSPKAYHALVQASEAVRATAADAGLDRILVELVNLRVSQINGCAYCLDVHTKAALRAGETTQRLGVLPAWRDTELFAPRERAALALAEATTDIANATAQEDAYEDARQVLTEDEISAVIWVALTINAFNRVSIMSKHPVRGRPQG
jgi:AhpD family alkylhydroperoxidase